MLRPYPSRKGRKEFVVKMEMSDTENERFDGLTIKEVADEHDVKKEVKIEIMEE